MMLGNYIVYYMAMDVNGKRYVINSCILSYIGLTFNVIRDFIRKDGGAFIRLRL